MVVRWLLWGLSGGCCGGCPAVVVGVVRQLIVVGVVQWLLWGLFGGYCEGWWLSSCCGSVAEYWWLSGRVLVAQWQSTGGSSHWCPRFDFWPAFSLSSIFASIPSPVQPLFTYPFVSKRAKPYERIVHSQVFAYCKWSCRNWITRRPKNESAVLVMVILSSSLASYKDTTVSHSQKLPMHILLWKLLTHILMKSCHNTNLPEHPHPTIVSNIVGSCTHIA